MLWSLAGWVFACWNENLIFSKLKMQSFPLFSTIPIIIPNCLEKKEKKNNQAKKSITYKVQTLRQCGKQSLLECTQMNQLHMALGRAHDMFSRILFQIRITIFSHQMFWNICFGFFICTKWILFKNLSWNHPERTLWIIGWSKITQNSKFCGHS